MPRVLGDEEKEKQAADRPNALAKNDGQMFEKRSLVESLPDTARSAKEIPGEEPQDKAEAVGIIPREIEPAKRSRKMREHREPGPEEQNDGGGLKRDKKRLNASDALGNHEKMAGSPGEKRLGWKLVPRIRTLPY